MSDGGGAGLLQLDELLRQLLSTLVSADTVL